jgi:hypothetical protein
MPCSLHVERGKVRTEHKARDEELDGGTESNR